MKHCFCQKPNNCEEHTSLKLQDIAIKNMFTKQDVAMKDKTMKAVRLFRRGCWQYLEDLGLRDLNSQSET